MISPRWRSPRHALLASSTLLVIAGGLTSIVTITTGRAPSGSASDAVEALTLAALIPIQVLPIWRARDEPLRIYLLVASGAATTTVIATPLALAGGALLIWFAWAVTVDPQVQQATQAWAAVLAFVAFAAHRLGHRQRPELEDLPAPTHGVPTRAARRPAPQP
jgi:hypothetical protein